MPASSSAPKCPTTRPATVLMSANSGGNSAPSGSLMTASSLIETKAAGSFMIWAEPPPEIRAGQQADDRAQGCVRIRAGRRAGRGSRRIVVRLRQLRPPAHWRPAPHLDGGDALPEQRPDHGVRRLVMRPHPELRPEVAGLGL